MSLESTVIIDTQELPTHVASVARRLNVIGDLAFADTFLETSYLAEAAIKSVAAALRAAVMDGSPEDAYRLGYELVRSDGLGDWEEAIRETTAQPLVSIVPFEFRPLVAWLTKKRTKPEDAWYATTRSSIGQVLELLDSDDTESPKELTVLGLLKALVLIRNKTKAHGALGRDFFAAANRDYMTAVTQFVETCPLFDWKWFFVFFEKHEPKFVLLSGDTPCAANHSNIKFPLGEKSGIYVVPENSSRAFFTGDLLRSNFQCTEFLLPNGAAKPSGKAEFIDYGSGKVHDQSIDIFMTLPVPPPPSETEGLPELDVQSNLLGNLPPPRCGYVERSELQDDLEGRLRDKNHHIITLHGQGGMGKTSLALYVAHKLASEDTPPFENIVWFSARDVDLRPTGPVMVKPDVLDLKAICKKFAALFSGEASEESFGRVLQSPAINSNKGTLFIFDNFETLRGTTEIHRFLDANTLLPNKVLITSRERSFKADYPIEVKGMEFAEAQDMLMKAANELEISALLTDEMIRAIYSDTDGHPYVMRVIIGEMAKEKRYVPPKTMVGRRADIVNAVFERSFTKLSRDAKNVFLTVSNWKTPVRELALTVVLGVRGLDVEAGIEESLRLSLILRHWTTDEDVSYSAPHLARSFGQKKLTGDPDQLLILQDLQIIRQIGGADLHATSQASRDEQGKKIVDLCLREMRNVNADTVRLDAVLEALATLWPEAWLHLAEFRKALAAPRDQIENALRRAVEELPFSKEALLARAEYAEQVRDDDVQVASLVRVADLDPKNPKLLSDAAKALVDYLTKKKLEIPRPRRGIYLSSVRNHMENIHDKLDPTALSRLAWLFLFEDNRDKAKYYANVGLKRDPKHYGCKGVIANIRKYEREKLQRET
jgi:hypothetical protein